MQHFDQLQVFMLFNRSIGAIQEWLFVLFLHCPFDIPPGYGWEVLLPFNAFRDLLAQTTVTATRHSTISPNRCASRLSRLWSS